MYMNNPADALPRELRAEAARQKLTHSEIAERAGMSAYAVARRLNGHVPLTVTEADRMAVALGVSLSDLLSRTTS